MAYDNYYNNANPYMYSQAYQASALQRQMISPNQNLQIQNGGFVSVRSEQEARNYPVAPGNSVTFRDETAPYVYTKTMGFSQLDRPVFEKYRLIKEEIPEERTPTNSIDNNFQKKFEDEINQIWEQIKILKESKKEVVEK